MAGLFDGQHQTIAQLRAAVPPIVAVHYVLIPARREEGAAAMVERQPDERRGLRQRLQDLASAHDLNRLLAITVQQQDDAIAFRRWNHRQRELADLGETTGGIEPHSRRQPLACRGHRIAIARRPRQLRPTRRDGQQEGLEWEAAHAQGLGGRVTFVQARSSATSPSAIREWETRILRLWARPIAAASSPA